MPGRTAELPAAFTANVEAETLEAIIGSFNVAVIFEIEVGTFVAPEEGFVFNIVGGVGEAEIKSPNTRISDMLAQLLTVLPFTVILTYLPVVSGKS